MSNGNRFNLVDEPWIPVEGVGKIGLRELFSGPGYLLTGTPTQKIVLVKFLLAIAQSANTPEDEDQWKELGVQGLSESCLSYLERWYDRFFLYGDRPFLQMPAIKPAALKTFSECLPEISTGNTVVVTQWQGNRDFDDADKVLLLLDLMGFGFGGKADNRIVLSPDYQGKRNDKGKTSTSMPGAFLGHQGYLHSFLWGESLQETVWLNLFTREQIFSDLAIFRGGMGVAPWEQMPENENCPVAEALKSSLMGKLVPVSAFYLLDEDGLHYSEGIVYPGYKEGGIDPSVSLDSSTISVIWVDPLKRPWRSLPSLLSFLVQSRNSGFDCLQIKLNLSRAGSCIPSVGIWSGGIKASGGKTRKHFIAGEDDYLESLYRIKCSDFGAIWFNNLKLEMGEIDILSRKLYGSVLGYYKLPSSSKNGKPQAVRASNLFWQLCERYFQRLIDDCKNLEAIPALRSEFAGLLYKVYDITCPKETARQMDRWARNLPNIQRYLHFGKENS